MERKTSWEIVDEYYPYNISDGLMKLWKNKPHHEPETLWLREEDLMEILIEQPTWGTQELLDRLTKDIQEREERNKTVRLPNEEK